MNTEIKNRATEWRQARGEGDIAKIEQTWSDLITACLEGAAIDQLDAYYEEWRNETLAGLAATA
jgi:hypothetical protein|tara:strand:+ start:231 stop:422 length:192 start_codon:yes stop_codon:yes gene_type:complete